MPPAAAATAKSVSSFAISGSSRSAREMGSSKIVAAPMVTSSMSTPTVTWTASVGT